MELLHQWGINMGKSVQNFGSKPSTPKGKDKSDCEQLLNELAPFVEQRNRYIQELCDLELASGRNTPEYAKKLNKLKEFNRKFDERIGGLRIGDSDGLSRYALEYIKKKHPSTYQYFSYYFAAHAWQLNTLRPKAVSEEVVARLIVEGLNSQIEAIEKNENNQELAKQLITARYEILKDYPETEKWFSHYGFFEKDALLSDFGAKPISAVSEHLKSYDIVDYSRYYVGEMIKDFTGSCEASSKDDNQFCSIMRVLYYQALSKVSHREEQVDAMNRALGIYSSDELDKYLPTSSLYTLNKTTSTGTGASN